MPKRVLTPAEKKRLSYERDGRNTYGQSNKASRKAIPRFKAASKRAMRHNTKQIVAAAGRADEVLAVTADRRLSDRTFEGLHPGKRKDADTPLGETISLKKKKRAQAVGGKARRRSASEGASR